MYTRPGCPHSVRLRAKLRLARIPYTSVDIWEDAAAAAVVRSGSLSVGALPLAATPAAPAARCHP